jgi:NAD(P)-dependent dehydrogenase (short-subunit alcohol dehydrogenase family)
MNRRNFIQTAVLAGLATPWSTVHALAPKSTFGPKSTAMEVTEGLNLAGLTAVVTGCNSGIGYETMRVLALRGAHVIGTARTLEKGREACSSVKGKATPVVLELTDFDSIVACTDQINAMNASLDMLILNAGIIIEKFEQAHGLEKQFVVNHLGHFILANRLLERVQAARQGRVVVVGSGSHRKAPVGGIQFDNLSGEGWNKLGYEHSKLANALFSLELAKRMDGTRVTSNYTSPGHTRTNALRYVSAKPAKSAKTAEQGAATICYVAAHPSLKTISGEYFADCNPVEASAYARDHAMAARLWQVSTELTRKYLPKT